jgi:hypothetical protein
VGSPHIACHITGQSMAVRVLSDYMQLFMLDRSFSHGNSFHALNATLERTVGTALPGEQTCTLKEIRGDETQL